MSDLRLEVAGLAVAIAGGWLVPALGVRMLVPSLEASAWVVPNYRGRKVFLGLGIVWVFWALALTVGSMVMGSALAVAGRPPLATVVILVLLAFVFGAVDDVFGTSADKGFRGHLRGMAKGRLTTGGLKLLGIVAAGLWAAVEVAMSRRDAGDWSQVEVIAGVATGAVLIAGSANLVNLLDLRPGRALKGYLALLAVSFAAWVFSAHWGVAPARTALILVATAAWLVGPVLAVWRYDLSERGMLGDAGANAAGALAGLALMVSLPPWGIAVAALVVAGLNLASERFSFSRVIEQNRLLSRVDRLGRAVEAPRPPDRLP